MRVGIQVEFFIICITQPFERFLTDTGLGNGGIKKLEDGSALGAAEMRVTTNDDIGRDTTLAVGRPC